MERMKELLSDTRIITCIVILTFMTSMFVGYKVREYQLEQAHARYKQERLEAYMAFNQLIEKYANMAQNIETGREGLK